MRAKFEFEYCMSRTGSMVLNIHLLIHYVSTDNDEEELHRGTYTKWTAYIFICRVK